MNRSEEYVRELIADPEAFASFLFEYFATRNNGVRVHTDTDTNEVLAESDHPPQTESPSVGSSHDS